ncbi:MAG: type III pantothenate kinase [Candidatus Eisenbacteria bacterium]|uniref:Type III pantothenate kinase n=1 Tax=Eiseniibacteriota bacterium TaxID=2212470 RepID=A0A956SB81_UNCEI|nr:type III pantothenate kinase [Candidatus Eisenbacteria bacterium]
MSVRKVAAEAAGPGLAINVGNTRVALGVFGPNGLLGTFRLASRIDRSADEVQGLVTPFLEPFAPLLDGAWCGVASVVPARTPRYQALARSWTGSEPYLVRGDRAPGLFVDVPDPAAVGGDRIANAAAAGEWSSLPCIVVDLGTATHLEVVTSGPTFIGGVIAPGVSTAAEALFTGTARLAAVELEMPEHVLGRTTRECLQSGIFHGAVAQIEGLVRAVRKELVEQGYAGSGRQAASGRASAEKASSERAPSARAAKGRPAKAASAPKGRSGQAVSVLTTGGLAPVFAPESSLLRRVVPELTLQGIAILARRAALEAAATRGR